MVASTDRRLPRPRRLVEPFEEMCIGGEPPEERRRLRPRSRCSMASSSCISIGWGWERGLGGEVKEAILEREFGFENGGVRMVTDGR